MFHRQFSLISNVTQKKRLFGGWQQRKEQRKSRLLLECGLINNTNCHTGKWCTGLPSPAEIQVPPCFLILFLCWGYHEKPWPPLHPPPSISPWPHLQMIPYFCSQSTAIMNLHNFLGYQKYFWNLNSHLLTPRWYLKFTDRTPFYTSAEIHLDDITSQIGGKLSHHLAGFLFGFVLVQVVGSLVHKAASVW